MITLNYFFLYETSTGAIVQPPQLSASNPWPNPPSSWSVLSFEQNSAPADVVMAYTYPQRYLILGSPAALVLQPYFTVALTESSTAGDWTATATLNNPPSTPPTSCTITVAGIASTVALSGNVATLAFVVDASAANQTLTVSAAATGCVSGQASIGSASAFALTASSATGTLTVIPAAVGDYQAFLFSQFPNLYVALQMTAAIQHLSYDMHRVACAPLESSMTAAEQATFSDLVTNVFPDLVLTLANAQSTAATLYAQTKASILQFAALQSKMDTAVTNWY